MIFVVIVVIVGDQNQAEFSRLPKQEYLRVGAITGGEEPSLCCTSCAQNIKAFVRKVVMAESRTAHSLYGQSCLRLCPVQRSGEEVTIDCPKDAQKRLVPDYAENNIPCRQMSKISGLSTAASAQLEESDEGLSETPSGTWGTRHQQIVEEVQSDQHRCGDRISVVPRLQLSEGMSHVIHNEVHESQNTAGAPYRIAGFESLGSNMSIADNSPDNFLIPCNAGDEPIDGAFENTDEEPERNRSQEAIWNEQVIKQVLEEEPPPSLQVRLLDVFSSTKRRKQRIEDIEIARALEEKTAETDVVMFQRPDSSSDVLSINSDVPVVAFDEFHDSEESVTESENCGRNDRPSMQLSCPVGEGDGKVSAEGRRPDHETHPQPAPARPSDELHIACRDAVPAAPEHIKKPQMSAFSSNEEDLSFGELHLKDSDGAHAHTKKVSIRFSPRSWLWSRKMQPPKSKFAPEDEESNGDSPETPKSIRGNATVGYELFLQDAELDVSPRSRLCRPGSHLDGCLDF